MKIICIARNYADHISELSNKKPKELLFFLKPDTSLLLNNKPFFYCSNKLNTETKEKLIELEDKVENVDSYTILVDEISKTVLGSTINISSNDLYPLVPIPKTMKYKHLVLNCPTKNTFDLKNILERLSAKILEENDLEIIVQFTGSPNEVKKMESILQPYKIIEQTRSGLVSMATGTDYIKK